jgi:hypothetical protein
MKDSFCLELRQWALPFYSSSSFPPVDLYNKLKKRKRKVVEQQHSASRSAED